MYDMINAAKELDIRIGKFIMKRNILLANLRYINIIQSDLKNWNIPRQEYFDKKYFIVNIVEKNYRQCKKVLVTAAGVEWLKVEIKKLILISEKEYWKEFYPNEMHYFN